MAANSIEFFDLSANPRISVLIDLVNSLSRMTEPRDLIETFIGGMRKAYGSRCVIQVSTRGLAMGRYRVARIVAPREGDLDAELPTYDPDTVTVHKGGFLAKIIQSPTPKMAQNLSLDDDPVLGNTLSGFQSLIAVPVFQCGMPEDWVILLDRWPDGLKVEDLEELILRANLVVAASNNLLVAQQLLLANVRIQKEMEHIALIQRALLPSAMPQVPGLRIATSYETFDQAGGDMYDFVPLGDRPELPQTKADHRWALLIGDVSGHGPSAAVVMAMFHSILHAYPRRPDGPGEMLSHVNRHLCSKPIGDCFVTAFLAIYDPLTRQLSYARAGHNPPLLYNKDQPPTVLDAVGELPLGIEPDTTYTQTSIELMPGQTLLLYTDGITEARSPSGEWFGTEGIVQAMSEGDGEPSSIINMITRHLHRHQEDIRPKDDQTAIAIQVD